MVNPRALFNINFSWLKSASSIVIMALLLTTTSNSALADIIYVSFSQGGNFNGLRFRDEDIIEHNTVTNSQSMHFDGSDVGLRWADINAFTLLPDDSILMSFRNPIWISGLGRVDDSDIVRFIPTSLGPTTAGSFIWFFDGSDVGLGHSTEDIDAISFAPDGRLVISTAGATYVHGAHSHDEDLLVFNDTSFGTNTAGTWELYFDGSDVRLRSFNEDIWGTSIDPSTDEIYITTRGNFSVGGGVNGRKEDIFICAPNSLGSSTSCDFSFYFDGSAAGFRKRIDGLFVIPGTADIPPTAVDDTETIAQDDPATTIDVLANDTDPDGGPISIDSVTQPANGTVVITNGGADLTYEPDPGYCNDGTPTDDFTYTLTPGGSTATVSVTVTCPASPTAVDDTATVDEDDPATTIDVLTNDLNAGAATISAVTQPTNGTVVITNAGADLTYQPGADYCNDGTPTDDFTYTLTPGGSTANVNVTVTCVDDAPVAVDDTATVAQDDPATTIDVLANDTDIDVGPISIDTVTQPANGTVVITNGGDDLTYQPDAGFCNDGTPTDDFTYTLTPGGSTATVSVTVTCPASPTAVDDTATVDEDDPATTIDVLANDLNAGAATISAVTQPANGTVVNNGTDLTYQPNADYCNDGTPTDDFTYTLSPGGSVGTVSVTVTCIDDAPVAVDDTATVAQDDPATTIDVLANDTDIDVGPISIDTVTQPANGTVVITGGGADLTYQPDAGFCNDGSPTDDFTYTLAPGGATATVQVTVTCPANPTAVDDTATVAEDDPATVINVLSNDLNAGAATISAVTQPANGTVVNNGTNVTYQPDPNYCNDGIPTDDFTYTLSPGGSSANVNVTVTCIDDAPVAVDDTATVDQDAAATTINVLANDTDIDGGPISIASVTQPTNGTVVITGGGADLTYQPDASFCNDGTPTDDFTYTLTPGGSIATVRVTVTCSAVATAVDDTATVTEDSGANTIDVLANDTDLAGATIASVTQPIDGTVVITNGGADLTYQPDANFCTDPPGTATDDFTYTLTSGGATGTATVSVTVTCVNDPPVVPTPNDFPVTGNIRIAGSGLLAGVTDADGAGAAPFSIGGTLPTTSTNGGDVVITDVNAGTFTYDPPVGFNGTDTFDYVVCDSGVPGTACSAPVTVTLNVSDMIWFIDSSAGGGGDGRLSSPFNCLVGSGCFDTTATDVAGDSLFIADGNYTCGLTLLNNQIVVGDGSSGTLSSATGITISANSNPAVPGFSNTDPVLSSSNTDCITLASGNTVRGLTVGNTGTGTGITGSSVGSLTVADTSTSGTGQAVDIDGGALNAQFDQIASSVGTNGMSVQNTTGSLTVSGATTIDSRGSTGLFFNNVAGTVNFGATSIPNQSGSTGYGIQVLNSSAAFTFASTNISDTVVGTAGTYSSTTERPTNDGDGDAIFLRGNTGSFVVNGGTLEDIADNAVDIRNSNNTTLNGVSIVDGSDGNAFSTVNSAIQWHQGSSLSLINVTIEDVGNNAPITTGGANVSDDGLKAYDVSGDLIIEDSVFDTGFGYVFGNSTNGSDNRAVELDNDTGTDLNVTVTGSTFQNWDLQGLNLRHIGGSLDVVIGGSTAADANTFTNINGAAVDTGPSGQAATGNVHGLLADNNSFTDVGIALSFFSGRGGALNGNEGTHATVRNNSIDGTTDDAIRAVAFGSGSLGNTAQYKALITGNTIINIAANNQGGGGGNGFFVAAEDGTDAEVDIASNSQVEGGGAGASNNAQIGITTQNQRGSDLDLILTGNNFNNFPDSSTNPSSFAIGFFQNGSGSPGATQTIRFGGNNWNNQVGGFFDTIQFDNTSTFSNVMEVEGYTGGGNDGPALLAYLNTVDSNVIGFFVINDDAVGNGTASVTTPTLPPLTP